ncbi:hypothetical protein OG800_16205 [Streptomyces sp. NBC_00445]|uniref:hypothetical protein n=1 Tax=Streptomyces sp. NBC_00445 TaxID=2975745 RepID=UPI002E24EC79
MAVDAPDLISRDSVLSRLRRHPEIEVREESDHEPGTVVIVVHGTFDDIALARLRRVVQDEGARVVLVVSALRETELPDVVECGVTNVMASYAQGMPWRRRGRAT